MDKQHRTANTLSICEVILNLLFLSEAPVTSIIQISTVCFRLSGFKVVILQWKQLQLKTATGTKREKLQMVQNS